MAEYRILSPRVSEFQSEVAMERPWYLSGIEVRRHYRHSVLLDGFAALLDDEFHGTTPSILKLESGNHQVKYRLVGYKPHSQPLNLMAGTGLRTVRINLEKLP
jgi:hypothetical protein